MRLLRGESARPHLVGVLGEQLGRRVGRVGELVTTLAATQPVLGHAVKGP